MNLSKYFRIKNIHKNNLHGAVMFFLVFSPFFMPFVFDNLIFFYFSLFLATTNCISYLINIKYLIPQYFKNKHFLTYFIFFIVIYLLGASGNSLLFSFLPQELIPAPFQEEGGRINDPHPSLKSFVVHFFPATFIFVIGIIIELTHDWMLDENRRKDIENERLHSELSFLKSQINPHFLFNTLNNIYSLAADKSDDTETAILKLSALMRYILYESNVKAIALDKEIEHIQNYIDLQKLRLSSKKDIQIDFEIKGDTENKMIEPLLLIPFIENAFKHGLSYLNNSVILICIECKKDIMLFKVRNTRSIQPNRMIEENSGIGLKNVKRRLELLYPEQHELKIEEQPLFYEVTLKMKIYENAVYCH